MVVPVWILCSEHSMQDLDGKSNNEYIPVQVSQDLQVGPAVKG